MVGESKIYQGFPARIYHYPAGPEGTVYVAVSILRVPIRAFLAPPQWQEAPVGWATDVEGGFGKYIGRLHRERWFRTFEQAATDYVQVCDMLDALSLKEYCKLESLCNGKLL